MIDFFHHEAVDALDTLNNIRVLLAVIKTFMVLDAEQLQNGFKIASKEKTLPHLPKLFLISNMGGVGQERRYKHERQLSSLNT